jgi:hypothetical protein
MKERFQIRRQLNSARSFRFPCIRKASFESHRFHRVATLVPEHARQYIRDPNGVALRGRVMVGDSRIRERQRQRAHVVVR